MRDICAPSIRHRAGGSLSLPWATVQSERYNRRSRTSRDRNILAILSKASEFLRILAKRKSERNGRNGHPRNSDSGNWKSGTPTKVASLPPSPTTRPARGKHSVDCPMHARVGVSVGFGRPAAMAAAFYGDWTAIARESRASSSRSPARSRGRVPGGVMRRELRTSSYLATGTSGGHTGTERIGTDRNSLDPQVPTCVGSFPHHLMRPYMTTTINQAACKLG